ncbi:trypsin alpha-like [Ostrinia nubilalis]|uniref:trypsin alpha-like n=1 Tax=Ostrinia nubilalis TaxID=29057 RepID=UPI0030823AED
MLTVFFVVLILVSVRCFNNSTKLPELESRIYSGYDVGIDQYSYASFLYFETTSPSSCGGSLIMVQAVLTAAHCVDELRYSRGIMYAYFGGTIPNKFRAVRQVVDYEINPKYDEEKGRNNLAVAFLSDRVPLQHYIKKIPLTTKEPKVEDIVFSAGWGKQRVTEKPTKLPDFSKARSLKATKQRVLGRNDCNRYAGFKVSATTLCTMPEIGHFFKDDAGNGLVKKQPVLVLVGVLSFVSNGISVSTGVFTSRDWIIAATHRLYTGCLKEPIFD